MVCVPVGVAPLYSFVVQFYVYRLHINYLRTLNVAALHRMRVRKLSTPFAVASCFVGLPSPRAVVNAVIAYGVVTCQRLLGMVPSPFTALLHFPF